MAQRLFSTFGEFNIQGGQSSEYYYPHNRNDRTVIAAAGTFGVQLSIIAVHIGAGPVLYVPKGTERFSDALSVQFPIGVQLRIPLHKDLLVGGVEANGIVPGYAVNAGMLFAGKWNYRGLFFTASYDPRQSRFNYFGGGLAMTVTHY